MNSLDMILDKARGVIVAGDDLQTAIIKATSADPAIPKTKHVVTVIAGVSDYATQPAELFKYLKERMHNKNWIVRSKLIVYGSANAAIKISLKALIVVHEVLLCKDDRGARYLGQNPNILNMSSYPQRVGIEGAC